MNSALFNMNRTPRLQCPAGLLRSGLALVVTLGLSLGALNAENPYWDEYGAQAVYVEQDNNGIKQRMKFLDYKDGMLVSEIEMKSPDGSTAVAEVAQPISATMVKTLSLKLDQMPTAELQLKAKNIEGALTTMRPEVYPLIKFIEVPASFRQLHLPIQTLLSTLIYAEAYDEARDLLVRIPLDKVSTQYSVYTLQLLNAYIGLEEYEHAEALANVLPLEGSYAKNISPLMKVAETLRNAEKHSAAIPLYLRIRDVVPAASKANINMWLAYSLVLADRLDEALPIMQTLREPHPKDRLFSLFKLLQGTLEYRRENYSLALDILTRGFVRAQTSYSWVPEMLYLVGDCYRRLGDVEAARNVWTEISVLYPDSVWGPRADAALAKLPPKQDAR